MYRLLDVFKKVRIGAELVQVYIILYLPPFLIPGL